ncbi:ArsC family reductase [Alginatibacterium sediminis]|uniref:ArsC family reductase n=1 Tax=Alginatibacterium sediminis TaxID=2164068 RepID=A0A420EBP5_9ALTE|nr:ArsC family reductase [Alginatibacterium sediminis]RKF18062.1 ArsC family reductase [Alginatibacterium sediminis]
MPQIYGISNCDTIRKAKRWLDDSGIEYQYIDYRKDGLDAEFLKHQAQVLGWEVLINKRGTTFRQLDDAVKAALDESSAIELMLAQPALIKRPLLIHKDKSYLGFKPQQYLDIFEGNN